MPSTVPRKVRKLGIECETESNEELHRPGQILYRKIHEDLRSHGISIRQLIARRSVSRHGAKHRADCVVSLISNPDANEVSGSQQLTYAQESFWAMGLPMTSKPTLSLSHH